MDNHPAPMTSIDLRDITRGLQEAAAATNSLIAQQYINLFDHFFDVDAQALGAPMKAKMVEVAMDDKHVIRVPLFALVSPKGLALERMQVDLSVRVNGTEALRAMQTNDEAGGAAAFKVTIGSQGRQGETRDPDEVQIRMQFQASEPPEALNRLIEEYTKLINPTRKPATEPTPDTNEFIDAATVR
ncbi:MULTISPECIES: DUF2589 domain-containing protein [Pseudomonas]|uniref:DUF2589 domain-containing protein n=1 Tax=Pseudomonas putida (strain W619) TaxID=390235 RepID=B1J835_PSEPW|nr:MULTISPECIES: DUF2589 domain-containing protein [Pseudomonas]MDH1575603.1 DUF2589 domain-containing protein [Pseudomonas sp. GD03746]UTL83406.1 DUF2589 domain-containing protein [Pseudomonas putida]